MINYIIVDDETASHDIIEDYGKNLPYLQLKKNCYNAFEAMTYLQETVVDLMFLDIKMPKLTGFDFLRTLSDAPKIIVTSAYREYALEGYEFDIDDYLLKPFSLQRFVKAVSKINSTHFDGTASSKGIDPLAKSLFIKDYKKHYQVKLSDILFVEAFGNYIKVHLENYIIISHQTLSAFGELLPAAFFIKVHKSFIISLDKIDSVEGNLLLINSHQIPIGKMYRQNIKELLS